MTNAMGPPAPRNPNLAGSPETNPIVESSSSSSGAEEAATTATTMKSVMGPPPPRNPNSDTSPAINSTHELSSSSGVEIATTTATTAESALGPPPPRKLDDQPQFGSTDVAGVAEAESIEKDSESSELNETGKPTQKQKPSQGMVVPYEKPAWSGPPCHEFYLEVLKDGCIIERLNINEKGAYMFGRLDLCDFVLEHPTISRFHAVIQFKRSGDAYVYDLGSTHGTFLNKNQVEANKHIDLHVGDVIRFGRSSRLFIFQGPSELMPPETDFKIMREARLRERMLDREASLHRAKLDASLADGVSWGMGEDAIEEDEDDGDEITWQSYRGQLTDKQEKTREKILKRMEKIANMKKEINAIRAKDISQGGLTQGQQTQIARNEQRMAQIMEELENLEETLNDSIRESIGARAGKKSLGKKNGTVEDGEEYLSDDDEFYDRTIKKPSCQKTGDNQSIETAGTLLDKRDDIIKEIDDKKELLLIEKNKIPSEGTVEDEVGDALDAYMSGLSSQLVHDSSVQLEKELSTLQSELDRISYLLKIADPTGEATKKRELKLQELKLENSEEAVSVIKKEEPVETKKKSEPSAKADGSIQGGKTVDANVSLNNLEAGTDQGDAENVVYTVTKPQWLGAVDDRVTGDTKQVAAPLNLDEMDKSNQFIDYKDRNKICATEGDGRTVLECGIESAAPGLILRKRKQVEKTETGDYDASQHVTSSSMGAELMAEDAVALLLKHKKGLYASDENQDASEESNSVKEKKPKRVLGPQKPSFLSSDTDYESWVPPEGQSGDGRTSLNERYGY